MATNDHLYPAGAAAPKINELIRPMMDRIDQIERMRGSHENPTEWRLRKAFLIQNFDALEPERLTCLSNCFVNHELYGTGYPSKVMAEVNIYAMIICIDKQIRRGNH